MKIWDQARPLLRNAEQIVVANGYTDLRVDRVLGGSVEGLDVQMLLYPLGKQLDLSALAVQFRDDQRIRVLPCRVIAGDPNGLVRDRSFIKWPDSRTS